MHIEQTLSPSSLDINYITEKINSETPSFGSAFPFAFFIRNEDNEMIAGVHGSVVYGSIYTDQLWVNSNYRSRGLARKLMGKVEKYGRSIGCTFASVCTMSFQNTKMFYEKLGYIVDFERGGYVNQSSCFFLKKVL